MIKPMLIITLGGKAKNKLNSLCKKIQELDIVGLEKSEITESATPYIGDFRNDVQAEVFNLKHPSYVEGGREENYLANLHVIRKCIE